MRKLFAILLVVAMLTLCACGNSGTNVTGGNETVGGVNGETQSGNATSNPTDAADEGNGDTEDGSPEATTEPEIQESTAPSFDVSKLSVWGLAEPSFSYEYVGYSEGTNGADFVGRVYYIASADYATVQAYIETVSNAGWGGFIPDPAEAHPFGYSGSLGDYKMRFYWQEDGSILISVSDCSVSAVWDDEVSAYVIPAYGEYGSYGEYNPDYMYG